MIDASERTSLSLSVAELAFALGVQQSEQVAFDVIRDELGVEAEEEVEFALALAGHSLLARDLLREGGGDEYEMAPLLEEVTRLVAGATRSLICSRTEEGQTAELSFHFGPRGVVQRRVRDEFVHEFEISPGSAAATTAADFYAAPREVRGTAHTVRLRPSLVDEALFSRERSLIDERISQAHAPAEAGTALADDLLRYCCRGLLVSVDHLEDGTSMFEPRGALLKGPSRLWIVTPQLSGAEPEMEFSVCSRQALKSAVLHIAYDSPPPPEG
jgi:DNA-directed RNA polymerase subunit N (RpoN/RPB10)